MNKWLDEITWNDQGLVAAIAQDHETGKILMLAWMNEESFRETVRTKRACYFSRSRNQLWRKGEESGHIQKVVSIHVDCDADAILIRVNQQGAACHEGYATCFFRELRDDEVVIASERLVNPDEVYAKQSAKQSDKHHESDSK